MIDQSPKIFYQKAFEIANTHEIELAKRTEFNSSKIEERGQEWLDNVRELRFGNFTFDLRENTANDRLS